MTRDEAVKMVDGYDMSCIHDTLENKMKAREALIAALTAPAAGEDAARSWRCFHCDEVFASADAAREHFGSSELDEPGCKMLAKGELELLRDYRDMAARWQRCVSEDCDASRIYHSMSAKIATAEREAEQKGYDRGLEDGRLRAVPQGWKKVGYFQTLRNGTLGFIETDLAQTELHDNGRPVHVAFAAPAPEVTKPEGG